MEHTIIIAEAGVNHNGSLTMARQMVECAKKAGADYIKFQTFKAANLVNSSAEQAEYQKHNLGKVESQLDMLRRLELSFDSFADLFEFCKKQGVEFMSTPFDIESIDFLASLGMDYMKIPSGEITNLPYLRKIAKTGLPVIMSTGMCGLGDIEDALNVLYEGGLSTDNITLLHCNTEYPTPMIDVNLKAMETLHSAFGTKIGYSDHTKGIEVPIAAVAMGATVIEKHFTLDNTLPGPDHVASLNPVELNAMVDAIRNIELAIGTSIKHVSSSEKKNVVIARKSIVASRDIKKGEILCETNLTVKRPGKGISPMKWDEILGKRAIRNFQADELIEV